MLEPPLTRSQWVQQRLRRAIITGEFKPGEPLITTALAEKWSISQTPLREALRILAAEGLVDMLPQRTARVAQVSYRSFAELFEIRLMLEPLALRRSLERRDAGWEELNRQKLRELHAAVAGRETDPFVFESAHHDFHMALLSACGSEELLKMIDELYRQSVRMRLLSASPRGGLSEAIIEEHAKLLEMCRQGDVERAVEDYRRHIMTTLNLVLRSADPSELELGDLTVIPADVLSRSVSEAAVG